MHVDCEKSAKLARSQECLLIFKELPIFSSYKLDAKGKHLITKKGRHKSGKREVLCVIVLDGPISFKY